MVAIFNLNRANYMRECSFIGQYRSVTEILYLQLPSWIDGLCVNVVVILGANEAKAATISECPPFRVDDDLIGSTRNVIRG